jgi:hypothetical protein
MIRVLLENAWQRFQRYCTEDVSASGNAKGRFPRLKAVMFLASARD